MMRFKSSQNQTVSKTQNRILVSPPHILMPLLSIKLHIHHTSHALGGPYLAISTSHSIIQNLLNIHAFIAIAELGIKVYIQQIELYLYMHVGTRNFGIE